MACKIPRMWLGDDADGARYVWGDNVQKAKTQAER